MVSSYLPYPLFSGGHVRLFNLIRELSARHEITLVCETRPAQTDADVAAVEAYCQKVVTVARRKQWSITNIVRSGVSTHSFLLNGHRHREMRQVIDAELAEEAFDLIHVETFYVMQNLPPTTIPVVLVEHNIEHEVYARFVKRAPLALRPLVAIDVAKIKREEEASWGRADALVAVSAMDKHVMERVGRTPQVVPNGVNTEQFEFKDTPIAGSQQEKRILFIGDFRWLQNRDSAAFILGEIWPVLSRVSGATTRDCGLSVERFPVRSNASSAVATCCSTKLARQGRRPTSSARRSSCWRQYGLEVGRATRSWNPCHAVRRWSR